MKKNQTKETKSKRGLEKEKENAKLDSRATESATDGSIGDSRAISNLKITQL